MGLRWQDRPEGLAARLRAGCVVQAHPLAPATSRVVDATNDPVFDVAHSVITGCHGALLAGSWWLDDHETLSPRAAGLLTAVAQRTPQFTDDAFVRDKLHR
jgi:hypothetical protein